jgi:hypothetical protein
MPINYIAVKVYHIPRKLLVNFPRLKPIKVPGKLPKTGLEVSVLGLNIILLGMVCIIRPSTFDYLIFSHLS